MKLFLLCIILPGILITLFHLFKRYLLEEEFSLDDTILYYIKSSIIINIVMLFAIWIHYGKIPYREDITGRYIIKYALVGSIFGLFLPAIFYKIRNSKAVKACKEYKIINIEYSIDNLKKYFKENKESLNKIIFFITGIILFISLDLILRRGFCYIESFTTLANKKANIITIFYSLLFVFLVYYLPKKTGKVTAILLYTLSIGLFIANYFFLKIKSDALSIYELNNAGEGFEFINFVFEFINVKFVVFILFEISLAVFNFRALCGITKKFKFKKLLFSMLICVLGICYGISLFEDYEDNVWDSMYHEKYYYDNFISPKKSISILGLYEYTARDIRLYVEGLFQTIGSPEEIDELISKYHTDYETNKYTGKFKGKNVIMIMMESIDYVVVDEETMPTLYKMMNEGWNFPHRYNQSNGSLTVATEYTSMTGLLYSRKLYSNMNTNNYSNSLPRMLSKNGYTTASLHENYGSFYNRDKLHKNIGFDNSYFLYDMKNIEPDRYNDAQFASNDLLYEKLVSKDKKFMSFFITISGHGPYTGNKYCESSMNQKECFSTLVKKTDNFLKILLERLKKDGLLDDTIIVLYADHHSYSYKYTQEDLKIFDKVDPSYKVKPIPFVIYNPKIGHKEFKDIYFNDIDMVPTLLNLFGVKYNPDYYLGRDVFSKAHKNIAMFTDLTWFDGKVYSGNRWEDLSSEEYKKNTEYVNDKVKLSEMIISNNYLNNIKE